MELKEMMVTAIDKVIDSGAIEKKIEETIQKSIESAIDDLFRSYSDFGKDLKEQLSEAMKINLSEVDLPQYNVMVENYIKKQTTAVMNEQHQKLIDDRLSEILKVEEKPEWRLSEIVGEVVEQNKADGEPEDKEKLSFHCEESHGFHHVYIDPEPNKDKYDCCIHIDIHEGKIYSAKVGDFKPKDFRKDIFLNLHGEEALIFRLYSQGVRIIVDPDECEDASYYPDNY